MKLSVRPLQSGFAAELAGLCLSGDLDQDATEAILAALDEHAVVVFPGQPLTDEQQLTFARRLGTPQAAVQGLRRGLKRRLQLPELTDISNLDENDAIVKRDDRRRMRNLGNRVWHSDSSFQAVRGKYSILSARAVPSSGGETEYCDLRAGYDALPDDLKVTIQGLSAEHSLIHSRAQLGFTDFSADERDALPPAEHALVWVHPGSKRTTLYLGFHASHVVGWPVPEGRMLLRELTEIVTRPQFVYRHAWRPDDLVIWDNRCVMHRGRRFDETQVRDLRRVTTLDLEEVL